MKFSLLLLTLLLLCLAPARPRDLEPVQLEGTWRSESKEYTFEAGRYRFSKGAVVEFGTYKIVENSELTLEVSLMERPSLGDPPSQSRFKIEFQADLKSFRIGDRVFHRGHPVPLPEW